MGVFPSRYTDDSNNVWVIAEHESAITSVILAVPTIHWPRVSYAVYDLTAELWAHEVQRSLIKVDCPLSVYGYSTPDMVGVAIETTRDGAPWLLERLRHLANGKLTGVEVPGDTRSTAIRRVYGSSSEFTALSSWAPSDHRYSISVEERDTAIRETDFLLCQQTIDRSKKILVAVGRELNPPDFLRCATMPERQYPSHELPRTVEDTFSVVHSQSAELAQVAIVTPGVTMSSSRKADLHVFWTLMREREGIFYRMARSQGGLMYSVSAFSREYHEGGFGMCVVTCAPDRVMNVVHTARQAAAHIASGQVSEAMVLRAVNHVEVMRGLSMRNPQAAAKALLASELSTVPPEDYSRQLACVSHESATTTAGQIVEDAGWRIRLTLPGGPHK